MFIKYVKGERFLFGIKNLRYIITARKDSLRRLCFYTCFLVILFTGGGAWSQVGGSAPGGAWWRPPPRTATAAGGTHPTGMHSCLS